VMLNDPVLNDSIKDKINSGLTVENAIIREFDSQKQFLKNSRDELLQERAIELDHLKRHLLGILRNQCIFYGMAGNGIIVAQSLTPSDIVNFREAGVLGIITELGGISAHASILARSFELPEVIGVNNATGMIEDGEFIIVDGFKGSVIRNPDETTIAEYRKRILEVEERKKSLGEIADLPAKTVDGRKISLMANVESLEDVRSSVMVKSDGIGLVRSESMIMGLGYFPELDEQYNWYSDIADSSYPEIVTIRTFDIGSDKYAEGLPHRESNPALGYRGIRFLLSRKDIFLTQLKAILMASKNKNVRLLLPMITESAEIDDSLDMIKNAKSELRDKKISFDEDIPVGIMIETPAAALMADSMAKKCDFLSIGTNDLTQYVLAADRMNELVSGVFNSFHPAVLRLIKMSIDAAKKNKIPVGTCGEFAGHSASSSLLLGMGITEISVAPSILLETKNRIRSIKYKDARKLAQDILKLTTLSEVLSRLDRHRD
ncbi:MAG: phosphoenolpyruvate--protein phosphotransferase, partial [Bacteroidota bacterium]